MIERFILEVSLMSLSQHPDKKDSQKSMMSFDILDCIQKNRQDVLKFLLEKNKIFYDTPIQNETLLSYAIKTPSATEETCNLFLEQKKKVEQHLSEIKTILSTIILSPEQIGPSALALYTHCRTFNNELKRLVLGDETALLAMGKENSLLRKIFPTLNQEQAIALLNKHKTALQHNNIFDFDEKFITEAKTKPEKLEQIMWQLSTERDNQTLTQKLVNYATVYSPASPLCTLFQGKSKFVTQCREQAKRLCEETLILARTYSNRSKEAMVYFKTIITHAYTIVDAEFLEECLVILDQHPSEKINIEGWNAITQNNANVLADIIKNKEFNLFHSYRHRQQENMLSYTVRLGHPACLKVLVNYIKEKKLNNVHASTPEIVFKLLSAPNRSTCLDILSEAKLLNTLDCETIAFAKLKEFNPNHAEIIASFQHAKLGVYRCTFAIKYPILKVFIVEPESKLFNYLAEHHKNLNDIIERDKIIIEQVRTNTLTENTISLDDLKIKDPQGRTLIEIAAECKSEKTLALLKQKKKQQGFAHQLTTLDGVGLYHLVMNGQLDINKDQEFLDFFASAHPAAQKARFTLINWITKYVNCYIFRKSIKYHDFDHITQLFSYIYQHETAIHATTFFVVDGNASSWLDALKAGIKQAREITEQEQKECQNADLIFQKLLGNHLTQNELERYYTNLDLLMIIKNKIINMTHLDIKLIYYELLFHIDEEEPQHQLHKIFHWFKTEKSLDYPSYAKLLFDLKKDWQHTDSFLKGLKKLAQDKGEQSSSLKEKNVIPLTTLRLFREPTKNHNEPDKQIVAAKLRSLP